MIASLAAAIQHYIWKPKLDPPVCARLSSLTSMLDVVGNCVEELIGNLTAVCQDVAWRTHQGAQVFEVLTSKHGPLWRCVPEVICDGTAGIQYAAWRPVPNQ